MNKYIEESASSWLLTRITESVLVCVVVRVRFAVCHHCNLQCSERLVGMINSTRKNIKNNFDQ